jgi:hypothetical protein
MRTFQTFAQNFNLLSEMEIRHIRRKVKPMNSLLCKQIARYSQNAWFTKHVVAWFTCHFHR